MIGEGTSETPALNEAPSVSAKETFISPEQQRNIALIARIKEKYPDIVQPVNGNENTIYTAIGKAGSNDTGLFFTPEGSFQVSFQTGAAAEIKDIDPKLIMAVKMARGRDWGKDNFGYERFTPQELGIDQSKYPAGYNISVRELQPFSNKNHLDFLTGELKKAQETAELNKIQEPIPPQTEDVLNQF